MDLVSQVKATGFEELDTSEIESVNGGAMDPFTVILAGIAIGIALYQVYDANDCP